MSVVDIVILTAVAIAISAFCLTLAVLVIYYGYRLIRRWMKQTDEDLLEH